MPSSRLTPAIGAAGAIFIGALANIGLVGIFENHQMAAWIVTLIASVGLIACIGKAINHRWDGVIVNGRNHISLSKLQMVAWTLLVLSALVTATAHNIHVANPAHALDPAQALNIKIADHLLIVMGIATTSLVASPAVLSLKGSDGTPPVAIKEDPADASWLDLFRGDLADSSEVPDLSKIQQFLVTLVVLSAYGIMIGKQFVALTACKLGPSCLFSQFPPMSEQVVWLIGISHAGYIAYKAAPKPTAAPSGAAPGGAGAPGAANDGAVG
jgi:hypothetical protein